MKELILILMGGVLINNYVLQQTIGICPFLGVSKKTNQAVGMGIAVTFVMMFATLATHPIYTYILAPFKLEYLQIIVFILVIAALVQFVEIVLKKFIPSLHKSLGVYLPLITTNCAVLGVAIMNVTELANSNILYAFINGVASGVGFTIAILILAGIREKMELADIPERFKGFPITLIAASIIAMGFAAFSGLTF